MIDSTEVENALLAYVLRYPSAYERLADIVTPEQLYWECNRWAWEAMHTLNEKGFVIDAISLGDELERMGRLTDFCTAGSFKHYDRFAIAEIRQTPISKDGGDTYALAVNDHYIKRRCKEVANKMATWAENGRPASAIMSDVEREFEGFVLHSGKGLTHTHNAQAAVAKSVAATEEASMGIKPITTGLIDLDKILEGLHKTDLIVVAARPGMGKSAFLLTVMLNALKDNKKALLFSIEMGVEQVTHRLLSQMSSISVSNIRGGHIQDDEWERYFEACEKLSTMEFIVNDMSATSIGQIRVESRKHPSDLILVDYIQLAEPNKKNERRDLDIGEITRGLKALAKELNVPILAAAQINRESEARADRKPLMSDLRESGSIENDADVVILMYKPSEQDEHRIDAVVVKHRNGKRGTARMFFHDEFTRFENSTTYDVSKAVANWQKATE